MKVLGIDPGTATIGWAILEELKGCVNPIAYGHISTSPNDSDSRRLAELSNDLKEIIEKYHPKEASVEKIFFFKNQKTIINVAQARGAILLTLEQNNVKIFGYTPLEVKQALTSYGRATKSQVQWMTKEILKLGKIPKPDDTADAIAIAIAHIHSRKMKV